MKMFDKNGLLFVPEPSKAKSENADHFVVIKKCYCINGHNLVSKQAQFGNYEGIVMNVNMGNQKGVLALSPVYGDKSRITFGIILEEGKQIDLSCPVCNVKMPVYSNCECGGDLLVMFTGDLNDFNNCLGVCNRVGCKYAEIKNEGTLLKLTAPGMF